MINYCSALMLSLERKSVEPMAAAVDPHNVRSQHQSLHHFVADSKWSDRTVMDNFWAWVVSRLGTDEPRYWIVEDTGIPKKGKHSAGVWREGTNEILSGWFTALRVRAAHRDHLKSVLRDEQWLLVEWPDGEEAPTKYSLSTLCATASLQELVYNVKMRWRIERDYQELKDELGLNHYEGRNWRGFHRHASLCIAAYAFLVAERLAASDGRKITPCNAKKLPYPKITSRGVPRRAQRHVDDSISTLRWQIAQAFAATLIRCPCCACRPSDPSKYS